MTKQYPWLDPSGKKIVWLDTSILIEIDRNHQPQAALYEREIAALQRDGYEVLIPEAVEVEFLQKPTGAANKAKAQAVVDRLKLKVDRMANQVPKEQVSAWYEEATKHAISKEDAAVVAAAKAGAAVRGMRNPVLFTREIKQGHIARMRQRGVMALEFAGPSSPLPGPKPPTPTAPRTPSTPSTPTGAGPKPPRTGFFRARLNTAKVALKEGLKGALSPEGLASMLPELVLAIADRVAAKEAIRNIQLKFLKEGFGKGLAAGAMGWTQHEVDMELRHRVTPYRIKGMEDPAGYLTRAYMLQLAQAYEDYGVDVGFEYSTGKTLAWKKSMLARGMPALAAYNWHFPNDPEMLFEYDFLEKLSWAMKDATNAIIEPMIREN
jgi:hypothetical protein